MAWGLDISMGNLSMGAASMGSFWNVHSSVVLGVLVPLRMTSPIKLMLQWDDLKRASQPASQSLLMDTRDVAPSAGNKWACVALMGGLICSNYMCGLSE